MEQCRIWFSVTNVAYSIPAATGQFSVLESQIDPDLPRKILPKLLCMKKMQKRSAGGHKMRCHEAS